jgi:hypothetical protein
VVCHDDAPQWGIIMAKWTKSSLGEPRQFDPAKQIFRERLEDIKNKIAAFQDYEILDEMLLDLHDKLQK